MVSKGTNNDWIYDLRYHVIVDLDTITTLASTTCIIDSNAYELPMGDEKIFNNFIHYCQGLQYTLIHVLIIQTIFVYGC